MSSFWWRAAAAAPNAVLSAVAPARPAAGTTINVAPAGPATSAPSISSAVDRVASGRFARVSRRPQRELLPDHHRQRRGTDDPGRHVVRLRIVKGADVREHEQRLHEEHEPDCHDQQRNPAEPGRPLRRACHDGALLAHQHRGGLALEVHVRLAAVDDARSARLRLSPRRRMNASSGVDEARAATARTAGAILGGSHCNAPPSHRLRHRATDDHGARLQGKIGT